MFDEPHVFDDEFEPRELLHREQELERVLRRIANPDDPGVLISGPSGVGKTILAQKAVEQCKTEVGVDSAFVRSLGKTTAGIMRAALEDLSRGPDSVRQTMASDEVRRKLREAIAGETVIVLDEGDDLPETDAIGELLALEDVTVIAIAHGGTDWLSRLDIDEAHPFDRGHIRLGRYTVADLADILERRVRQGLHRDVGDMVTWGYLESIADAVAGVARDGIQTLRAAGEITRDNYLKIDEVDVTDAYEQAQHEIRIANLKSLPFHHQVLFAIVHEAGELAAGELYDRYEEVSSVYKGRPVAPIAERQRRRKLEKLADYDLVNHDGENRGRTYWVVDAGVEPCVELPDSPTISSQRLSDI
jgi:Cdc6-like AAA superfamily ATPase